MLVREYKIEDNFELLKLYNKCFFKDFKEIILKPTGKIFVVIDDNKIIGMATLDFFNDIFKNVSYGYVNNVCVDEMYRKRGVGKLLMGKIDSYCKENDLDFVMLTSNKKRFEAWELYLGCGYEIRDTCLFEKKY